MWGIATSIRPDSGSPIGAVLICLYVIINLNWQQTASKQIANLVNSNYVNFTTQYTDNNSSLCTYICIPWYIRCFFYVKMTQSYRNCVSFEKKKCVAASSSSFVWICTTFISFLTENTEDASYTLTYAFSDVYIIYRLEYICTDWILESFDFYECELTPLTTLF